MSNNPYWSLLFSPAFGSYLHMLNWRALGDAQKAAGQKTWFVVSLMMLAGYIVLALVLPNLDARLIGLAFLLAWYFASARGQARHVKEKFGNNYPRKGWGKPLLITVGAAIAYVVIAVSSASPRL